MMREIGGRKERVVRASPSGRFARGFFSSIKETVSTGALGVGATTLAAAAAAASAAARERAAGVGATVVLRGALAAADFAATVFGAVFDLAGRAGLTATADFSAFPVDGAFFAAVLIVVLVGICVV
jgi:hypothetical protein